MSLFVFFFFNGDGFLEEGSFFFSSFATFFLFICLFFKLRGSPSSQIHPLTRVIPMEHRGDPLVEGSLKRFREMTQLAIAIEFSLWGAVMLVMVKVSPSTPALLFGLTTISKISLVCYRTGLFCLDKLINLDYIPSDIYHELSDLSVEGQNLYFGFRRFRFELTQLENSVKNSSFSSLTTSSIPITKTFPSIQNILQDAVLQDHRYRLPLGYCLLRRRSYHQHQRAHLLLRLQRVRYHLRYLLPQRSHWPAVPGQRSW